MALKNEVIVEYKAFTIVFNAKNTFLNKNTEKSLIFLIRSAIFMYKGLMTFS